MLYIFVYFFQSRTRSAAIPVQTEEGCLRNETPDNQCSDYDASSSISNVDTNTHDQQSMNNHNPARTLSEIDVMASAPPYPGPGSAPSPAAPPPSYDDVMSNSDKYQH